MSRNSSTNQRSSEQKGGYGTKFCASKGCQRPSPSHQQFCNECKTRLEDEVFALEPAHDISSTDHPDACYMHG